ncbi:MAG: hypothetical protein WBC44_15350 [Planctomycetaceae bacterium]
MDALQALARLQDLTVPVRLSRRRRRPRPKILIEDRGGVAAIVPSTGCRWEAADLARVRNRALSLLAKGNLRVGVDLAGAESLPSGFFAQLCHWNDRGAEVVLYNPGPAIRRMFWFQAFMACCNGRGSMWKFTARDTPAWRAFAPDSNGPGPP